MSKPRKKTRFLIVDDHELVRQGIRALLRAQRHWTVVGEAAGGGEAVQKALKLRPEVVILDITVPDLDGLEALRQIRDAVPNTKVLILTMHESGQMVRRVLEAGAQGYVLKSDMAAHLVKAIKGILQGKLSLSQKVSEIVLLGFLKASEESRRIEREKVRPTPREAEILRLLAQGKSNKEIASALSITVRTVETHRAKIMLKLDLHSVVDLVHYATRQGLVSPQET